MLRRTTQANRRFFVGLAVSAPRRRAAPSLGANLPFRPKVGFHFRTLVPNTAHTFRGYNVESTFRVNSINIKHKWPGGTSSKESSDVAPPASYALPAGWRHRPPTPRPL